MYPYWQNIIEPLLQIVQPACLVEIGCEAGKTTGLLLTFCQRHHAVLHGIDPSPRFDVDEWKRKFENRFIFHRESSLSALPRIEDYDVVLIDGDHNWYTVTHELKLIERASCKSGAFPIVLLHDVGWPYDRRDLYYSPDTIPDEYRHPFAKLGVHPDSAELLTQGGINSGLLHATSENGPRNGVLTAIEDFQQRSRFSLELLVIPGFHGLGILFSSELRDNNPALSGFLDSWNLPEAQRQYLIGLEKARVRLVIRLAQQ